MREVQRNVPLDGSHLEEGKKEREEGSGNVPTCLSQFHLMFAHLSILVSWSGYSLVQQSACCTRLVWLKTANSG